MTTNLTELERAALAWRKADKRLENERSLADRFEAINQLGLAEQRLRAAADRVLAADEVSE